MDGVTYGASSQSGDVKAVHPKSFANKDGYFSGYP